MDRNRSTVLKATNLPMHSGNRPLPGQWEIFLKALSDEIAEPTPAHPTVRCWTHASLAKLIQKIRRTTLSSTFPNTPDILKHLVSAGWAYRIAVDIPSNTTTPPSKDFYLLDISAAHAPAVDPLELLQAYRPDGILCYFSALTYHSLTTQLAPHHHIAALITPSKSYPHLLNVPAGEVKPLSKKVSLGETLFTYQGIPCYLTKRSSSRLIGIQTRVLGPRTNLRITTLEQTLIDTFHKPLHCGGSSVIFEAWEDGVTRFDAALLSDYLTKIDSHLLLRRVGAMFDLLEYSPTDELKRILQSGLEFDQQSTQATNISLLPGLEFPSLNPKWRVMTP